MAGMAMAAAGVTGAQTPAAGGGGAAEVQAPVSQAADSQAADGRLVGDGKTPATVSFLMDRAGVPVTHYLLTIREDGSGRYEADEAPGNGAEGRHIDRPLTMSQATVAKVFATARSQRYFNVVCESKIKNLAKTGVKTMSYRGMDGTGSCVYNYSEIKGVQALTDTFQAMAFTIDEGRKLEFKKRFDRLGLDAEMASLAHAAEQKQAVEMGTIRTILTQIAGDTELMERVRLRAAKLLELSDESR